MIALASSPAAYAVARVLLADDDDGGESKKSGPIGLVVIIVLCVACYFLFKSLSRHLRKVRDGQVPVSAPPPGSAEDAAVDAGAGGSAAPAVPEQEPAPPAAP